MNKIKFSQVEKDEFDKLIADAINEDIEDYLDTVYQNINGQYSHLYTKLYSSADNFKSQVEFVNALACPELIEIKDPEFYICAIEDDDYGFINYNDSHETISLNTYKEVAEMQTKFTKREARALADNFKGSGFDISKMKLVPTEDMEAV